jgi:hypothetical protein
MKKNYCSNCGNRLRLVDVGDCPNCGSPIPQEPALLHQHLERHLPQKHHL